MCAPMTNDFCIGYIKSELQYRTLYFCICFAPFSFLTICSSRECVSKECDQKGKVKIYVSFHKDTLFRLRERGASDPSMWVR